MHSVHYIPTIREILCTQGTILGCYVQTEQMVIKADHSKLKVADKVAGQGTIHHVYGQNIDWIVFLNEETKDLKVRFNNGSEAERLNNIIAPDLQALDLKAYRKFNKAGISAKNDIMGTALTMALNGGEESFEKAKELMLDFIESGKATKQVFSKGPNPQHLVYMDEDNHVGYEIREEYPDEIQPFLDKLNRIRHACKQLLPKPIRLDSSTKIGPALTAVIQSSPPHEVKDIVDKAISDVEDILQRFGAHVYRLLAFVAIIITVVLGFFISPFLSEQIHTYMYCGLAGTVGALISSFTRITHSRYDGFLMLLIQAISRVFLGLLTGTFLVLLINSNLAFGVINGNISAMMVLALALGFSEQWLPDFLRKLPKQIEE